MEKHLLGAALALAALGAAGASAQTQSAGQTCSRGADVRVIEVVTPGVVGASCDLRYTRDAGANVSVPYHADNSTGFCAERARALVASLLEAGYSCEGAESFDIAAAPVPADDAALDIDDILGAPPRAAAPAGAASGEAQPEALALSVPPAPQQTDPAKISATPAAAETPVPAPVRKVAVQGPQALAPTNASTTQARRPAGPVGRLAGANPDEARPVRQAQAANDQSEPAADRLPPPAAEAAAPVAAASAAAPRSAPDVIRAVLGAQAAAWNDGDLDAFMNTYWKSPDLRFVSGAEVTQGWNEAAERYRARYGDGADLGYLGFEALDVQMVDDDVAIVVGRFRLQRAAATDTGAFSLVMKRFEGVWRIVHDHTVADAR